MRSVTTAGAVLAAALAAGAWAQPQRLREATPKFSLVPQPHELADVEIDQVLEALVDRLGDPVYAQREKATAELLAREHNSRQLYAVLARKQLSAEQRHRLLTIVSHRLLYEPRGAVGIQADTRFFPDEIVIQRVLQDMPARGLLREGDRILELNGEPLSDWNEFVELVQSRRPGARITVTVERLSDQQPRRRQPVAAEKAETETLEVELELGSTEQLRDPGTGRRPGSPVYNRRLEEAEDAREIYGPQPTRVLIDG